MQKARYSAQKELLASVVIIVGALAGLLALGFFDPLPERSAETEGIYLYYGPEGETVRVDDIPRDIQAKAETALDGADYYGAFAVGSYGKTGVWTGAREPRFARRFALAACGEDCQIVAERLPRHRDPARTEPVATRAMAENLAVNWPFTRDYIALGGAGAWGHHTRPAGKGAWKRGMREAAADCEARRAAEPAPDPDLSPPCVVGPLREFVDLRPKPRLYPARYTIDLMELAPAAETRLVEVPGAPPEGWVQPRKPSRLHGARAASGDRTYAAVRAAGWPEAGERAALLKCNAGRRPGEAACVLTHVQRPETILPRGTLAVTPELYAGFLEWQNLDGIGAFAIGPFGSWGSSYGYTNAEDAMQKAADWCWYYTRRNWEYRQIDRAFLDPDLHCRIVAINR